MVMARTNGQLDDFNERARAHLRGTGELKGPDVPIGNLDIAIGDELVTRRNARWIVTTNKSRVINGARWEVTRIRHDGALDVTSLDGRGRATLPADYTMADDQLSYGYGSTVHRAQGSTVDQAIFLADEGASRNLLYVAASRARERNDIWLTREGSQPTSGSTTLTDDDIDVLRQVLKRTDQEATGSEVVWAKELGYELDDDRIHQLLTPAGRHAIQHRTIQLERGLRARNVGADDARSAVVTAHQAVEKASTAVDRADTDLNRSQKRLAAEEANGLVARVNARHDIADLRSDVAKKTDRRDSADGLLDTAAQRLSEAEATYDQALEVTTTANSRDLAIIDSLKQRLALDDRGQKASAGAGHAMASAGTNPQPGTGRAGWTPEQTAYANELLRRSRQAAQQPVAGFEQTGISRGM